MEPILAPCVRVADTGTLRGRGVYAERDYAAGEVIETSPVLLIDADFERLPIALRRSVFAWPGTPGTVHALALGYGSLYNGGNPANVRYERDGHRRVIRFIAARDVARGEELTINYSAPDGAAASEANDWFVEHGVAPELDVQGPPAGTSAPRAELPAVRGSE